MKSMWLTRGGAAAVLLAAILSSGCGRQGQAPAQLVIVSLGTGAVVDTQLQGGTGVPGTIVPVQSFLPQPLNSDVFPAGRDRGQVVLRQILRDQGAPGVTAAPSPLNDITVTEYQVTYRLPNGRKTFGVDVPYPIRGGLTLTVQGSSTVTGQFDLVRVIAKQEAPLAELKNGNVVLNMIADVTFYGRDQAGNAVSVTGTVQINFGDFA